MARTRRGPNLFEVMSKAPQGQVQRPRPGLLASLLGRNDQRTTSPAAMVAQPLTEEEAVAELAARRASEDAAKLARQEEERSRQEARAAKDEAKRTRQAAKL